MRKFVRSVLCLLLVGAVAAPLRAQDIRPLGRSTRAGFWWGVGLGAASAKVKCNSCGSIDNETMGMLDLHLGGTLSDHVTLGVQLTGASKKGAFGNSSDVTANVGDVNVSAYYYPKASGDLWLQGGLSALAYRASVSSNHASAVAGGLTLGAGYDFRFGRNASITPSLRAAFGGKSDLVNQAGTHFPVEWQTAFLELGVSVIWH